MPVAVGDLQRLDRGDPPVLDSDADLDHPEPGHDGVAIEGAGLRQVGRASARSRAATAAWLGANRLEVDVW